MFLFSTLPLFTVTPIHGFEKSFAETIKEADCSKEAADAARSLENDLWIQRRRAAHIVGPFLRRHGRLQLARILLDEDHRLAGKIAAVNMKGSWESLPSNSGADTFLRRRVLRNICSMSLNKSRRSRYRRRPSLIGCGRRAMRRDILAARHPLGRR